MKTTLVGYVRMVGLLAIMIAVVFFPPTSAHAGMAHTHSSSDHAVHAVESYAQTEQGHHLGDVDGDNFNIVDTTSDHSDAGQCCSSICVSTAMLETSAPKIAVKGGNHVAELVLSLASANVPGFLRPPNL